MSASVRLGSLALSLALSAGLTTMGCHRDRNQEDNHQAAEDKGAPPSSSAGPSDGKYERVQVDGVTVPMIQVMNQGSVVLVDTDGTKPRTWEEQYKRKGNNVAPGSFDLHKTNVNKNDTFEDDPVDRQGLWTIDAQGNLTRK